MQHMQQNTSKYWYYCVCVVAELLQMCCTCCRCCCRNCCTYSNFVLHFVASSIYCKLQQSATNVFYHFFNFCNRKCAILQHNLQHIFIHEYCIFIHLQQFLQQFQSNFTTNCHLYLLPVSTFLTLFRSKLYASSISL